MAIETFVFGKEPKLSKLLVVVLIVLLLLLAHVVLLLLLLLQLLLLYGHLVLHSNGLLLGRRVGHCPSRHKLVRLLRRVHLLLLHPPLHEWRSHRRRRSVHHAPRLLLRLLLHVHHIPLRLLSLLHREIASTCCCKNVQSNQIPISFIKNN